ncbi:hypothetical protein QL285_027313 [Trifolium repens]|nr:hypothetical protein QL285_027313 [Trifolium repens]
MSPRDLLDAESAPAVLERYLKDMSTLTPAQRLKFVEKARAKKAQPDSKVDALNQLEVGERDRKKRKSSDARISILVKTSGPSPTTVDQAANAEGEVKSPSMKKSRTLSWKTKKDKDVVEVDKELYEVEDPVVKASPAAEKTVAEGSQAGGASPWDPLFDLEVFLAKMVDMTGNSSRFNTTGSDELMRLALGYELKGLLLNYALASRQRAELGAAKEKKTLVEKNLTDLENDVKATKEKLENDVKSLKKKSEEEIAKLAKDHEEELAKANRDRESAVKTMNTIQGSLDAKDQRINTLIKDNEAALAELAVLRHEKAKWESEKESLEAVIGEQYEEGFQFALDMVKVLFPDIDQDLLGKADVMLTIEGDKLVPHAPAEMAKDSPAKESPTKELPAKESPADYGLASAPVCRRVIIHTLRVE